jgi:hypothetical protein
LLKTKVEGGSGEHRREKRSPDESPSVVLYSVGETHHLCKMPTYRYITCCTSCLSGIEVKAQKQYLLSTSRVMANTKSIVSTQPRVAQILANRTLAIPGSTQAFCNIPCSSSFFPSNRDQCCCNLIHPTLRGEEIELSTSIPCVLNF